MVYTEEALKEKIEELLSDPETEVVEYKEAKNDFHFNDIGKYFSALSNEANLKSKGEAWLLFGVTNDRKVIGTSYRDKGNLQFLKKEIVNNTNERMTFMEIYEIIYRHERIIAFQIPPATRGIPTLWNGAPWSRENESLAPLPLNKYDEIKAQIGVDWSREIVSEASIDDLDLVAIRTARDLFIKKNSRDEKLVELLRNASDVELLNKAGILIKGQVTNTALILLGKPEASCLFDGFIPRITWTLYGRDNSVRAYEHFDMPMLLAVDKAYGKIRNEKYRYITTQQTLFPDEVMQYDQDVVKELLNNCIAHSNYQLRGKINLEEFEDRLVFINEGNFIPETIEKTLEEGYKPPYYRNTFLCNAMVNLYMIDTISMGIPKVFTIQKDKCFPLPTYDLDDVNRVKVTLYGRVLDTNYTQLLHSDVDLDLRTVFLLDKIQKKETIVRDDFLKLKKMRLAEGRYPNIFVSYKVANLTGQKTQYVKTKGFGDEIYKEIIITTLKDMKTASLAELMEVMDESLPKSLDSKQKTKKLSNILYGMKNKGMIKNVGYGRGSKWMLDN